MVIFDCISFFSAFSHCSIIQSFFITIYFFSYVVYKYKVSCFSFLLADGSYTIVRGKGPRQVTWSITISLKFSIKLQYFFFFYSTTTFAEPEINNKCIGIFLHHILLWCHKLCLHNKKHILLTGDLLNLALFLLYSPHLFRKKLFSMQDKLVNNKQTNTLSQTKLLCHNNTNRQKVCVVD